MSPDRPGQPRLGAPGREKPWTTKPWVYDLRTNMHFTLKQKPIRREDFDEFVRCFKPGERQKRRATWSEKRPEGRWRAYTYDQLLKRDKVSLDLFWLRDESLEDGESLPDPDVLAAEIADDLQAAMEQFAGIAEELREAEAVLADKGSRPARRGRGSFRTCSR